LGGETLRTEEGRIYTGSDYALSSRKGGNQVGRRKRAKKRKAVEFKGEDDCGRNVRKENREDRILFKKREKQSRLLRRAIYWEKKAQ